MVFAAAELKQELTEQFERVGLIEQIGRDLVFATVEEAIAAFESR
jgi:hypothetical protein